MDLQDSELPPKDFKEYASSDYWEERYKKSSNDSFEWYYDYDTLKDVFADYFDPAANVLVVGNGNSDLCEEMAKCHKGRIVGIDISETVTKEMTEKHEKNVEQFPSMAPVEYRVVDATKMDYKHDFDAVIDKGTLDALNCGDFDVVENFVMKMDDALKEGPLFIISQLSEEDQMQEFLSRMVVLFDWEFFKYSATVYTAGDNPAIYVFEKKQRIPGEPFDIDEEVANFSIEVVDCSGEDEEESELHVCSQTEKQP